ncbi:MAG: PD-(D/E)XK nuclease family protein [Bdellovibrionota bacterium]
MSNKPAETISELLAKAQIIFRSAQEENSKNVTQHFNIFSILDRERDEEKGHSRFLGEILSPTGSHGLKDMFLQIFVDQLNSQHSFTIIADYNTEIGIETSAPWQGTGGRIDLRIETSNAIIVVENKIYAEDQHRQLERYYNYTDKYNHLKKGIYLIYLNLDGHGPNEDSLGDLPRGKVIILTYKDFIQDFLKKSISKSTDHPSVHQILIHYKNLIKKLTGDTIQMSTLNETLKLIDSEEKMNAALLLANAAEEKRIQLEFKFWNELQTNLTKKLKGLGADVDFKCETTFNEDRIRQGSNYYGLTIELGKIEGETVIFNLNKENGVLYQGLRFVNSDNKVGGNEKLLPKAQIIAKKLDGIFSPPHTNAWWIIWTGTTAAKKLVLKNIPGNDFIKFMDADFRSHYIEKLASEIHKKIVDTKEALGI